MEIKTASASFCQGEICHYVNHTVQHMILENSLTECFILCLMYYEQSKEIQPISS